MSKQKAINNLCEVQQKKNRRNYISSINYLTENKKVQKIAMNNFIVTKLKLKHNSKLYYMKSSDK